MNTKKHSKEAILRAIEILGGANNLAVEIGISYQTILNWKNLRAVPSNINCIKIERATNGKVTRKDILPGYPWEELK
jgi:DNA-binding transcriptional regulator YdaS (Cro superfamily)